MKSRFLILTLSVLQRLGFRKMRQQRFNTMICALFIDVVVTEEAAFVSVFINLHFNPKLCPSDCKGVLSILFVLGKRQHLLSLVYRPPNATILENMDIIKSVNDAKLSHYDIWTIVGDFNLPDVTYIFPFTTYNIVFDFFSDNFLHQLVQAPTRGNAILDLVWTNNMNMTDNVEVTSPIANSDHNTIIITLTGGCSQSGKIEPAQQKNRHLDIAAAAVILRNTDWHSLLSGKNSVDEMVTSFMAVIDSAIPFIQRQGMAKHNKGQSTLPKHIRKLIHKKRKMEKTAKISSYRSAN